MGFLISFELKHFPALTSVFFVRSRSFVCLLHVNLLSFVVKSSLSIPSVGICRKTLNWVTHWSHLKLPKNTSKTTLTKTTTEKCNQTKPNLLVLIVTEQNIQNFPIILTKRLIKSQKCLKIQTFSFKSSPLHFPSQKTRNWGNITTSD